VAVAVAKAGGGGDGGVGVLLRRSEGFGHSLSSREAGGHRGGEGAACAVRVRRVDTRAVEPVEGLTIAKGIPAWLRASNQRHNLCALRRTYPGMFHQLVGEPS